MVDLRQLLVTTEENEAQLPDVTAEKAELVKSLSSIEEAQNRQNHHQSEKQKATQDLVTALARGKEAARLIRTAAKLGLGPRNEKLVQFSVAPLRSRVARKAAVLKSPDDEPKEGTTGGTTGTATPPADPKTTNP
jgi:hypothetical protein